MSIGPRSLAIAAALGAGAVVATWMVTNERRSPAAAPAAVVVAPASHATPPIAEKHSPLARAPERVAPDDVQLARRARDEYGFDCPSIVKRGERRDGYRDVTCSSGVQLRIYAAEGAEPRIGPRH